MQVRDWDLGDKGEGGNKDNRYLFFTLAAMEDGMQSSSKRYKVNLGSKVNGKAPSTNLETNR